MDRYKHTEFLLRCFYNGPASLQRLDVREDDCLRATVKSGVLFKRECLRSSTLWCGDVGKRSLGKGTVRMSAGRDFVYSCLHGGQSVSRDACLQVAQPL